MTATSTIDPTRLKLVRQHRGGLHIWTPPDKGKKYVIGIDTSGGGPRGDWAVAAVVEVNDKALVAVWRGKYDPTEWGRMCARLGWHYNAAMLAFETHPSQHGLSACLAARDTGYPFLYRNQVPGQTTNTPTTRLGWFTVDGSRALMIDAVRVALTEHYDIPCAELLDELLQGKYGENGKPVWDRNDDIFVAYAIALKVAAVMLERGFVSEEAEAGLTFEAGWYKHLRDKRALAGRGGSKRPRLFNGA